MHYYTVQSTSRSRGIWFEAYTVRDEKNMKCLGKDIVLSGNV